MNKTIEQEKDLLSILATKQQNAASDPNFSVWVEASAGTGKTKVLSDRVLRILLSGANASRILCLTYTKAAAVEMKNRISQRLGEWVIKSEEELKKEIYKISGESVGSAEIKKARTLFAQVLDTPGGIKIQTLHSFYEEILKRFPLEAGVAPYFSVIDSRTSKEALSDISRKLILTAQENPESLTGQNISWLTANIKENKFSQILKIIIEKRNIILELMSEYEDFESFIYSLHQKLGVKQGETVESAIQSLWDRTDKSLIKNIAQALSHGAATDNKHSEYLYQCLEVFDYQKYKSVFLKKDNETYAKLASKNSVSFWPDVIDAMSVLAHDLQVLEDYFIKILLVQSTTALMGVAKDLNDGYSEFKRANAMLDFEDLVLLTKKLLSKETVSKWVLYKLDGGIDHILIDEAQDTSPNSWAIVKSLTEEFFAGVGQKEKSSTVFAVGDRKQSIYSFQGADPEEFDKMHRHFANKSSEFKKIKLDVSFRSTKAVLESVNHLFALEEAKSGVVINDEPVSHLPFRLGQEGKVQILPLVSADEDQEDEAFLPIKRVTKSSASAKLAHLIAHKIKKMVTGKDLLKSQNRPIRYRDFMVLMQTRNAFMNEFVKECKSIGVNITGIDKMKLLEQIAVQDLLSLAKFLLLPQDDLSLAEVLKSPLFDLTDDDLFDLCYERKGASLWQRLKANEKYSQAGEILSQILKRSDYLRPFELFGYVLNTLGGRKKFVARLGTEAEDAIDEFINLTLNFEKDHIPDLQNFIIWITADDVEIKRELEQVQEDAVRVMTVHGSKGLQAPIVILPDTIKLPNTKKGDDCILFEKDMAYFPLSAKDYDLVCEDIHEQKVKESYNEYRRLLYVALTRAEDRLYIAGFKDKGDAPDNSWYSLCLQTLQNIGTEDENKCISYTCPQEVEYKPKEEEKQLNQEIEAQNWLYEKAQEENPLSRPYSPSKSEDEDFYVSSPLTDNSFYYKRGLIIHSMLQYLPTDCDLEGKINAIDTYLEKHSDKLNKSMLNQIKDEVIDLISNPEFEEIFGKDSKAEVPIMGEVDGRIISAQIDRLVISKDKIIIVDFKTNRPAAVSLDMVPASYLNQLNVYKQLLEKIYPAKNVETYILWTNTANLMRII